MPAWLCVPLSVLVLKYSAAAATVLFQDNCACKMLTCLKLRRYQVFSLDLVFMIESVILISS